MNVAESAPDWEQIRPLLDAALDELSAADRDALVLRFMEQRSLAEVGAALGANEDAARKRVQRALEKMRVRLIRRFFAPNQRRVRSSWGSARSSWCTAGRSSSVVHVPSVRSSTGPRSSVRTRASESSSQ